MVIPAEINRRNRELHQREPAPTTPTSYGRRFVAYIDILGWTNACRDSRKRSAVFAVARNLSELPRHFSQDLKDRLKHIKGAVSDPSHQKTEVVAFSDSVVISTPVDVSYLHLFKFLTIVCRDLLTHGFLTRGGVTVGDLCHKENMVFGPALIEAVSLEEEEAIYPRLLCSRDLLAEINCSQKREPSEIKATIIDHLGRFVVNLLAFEQGNHAAWPSLVKRTIDTIALENLPDKELEKWQYMRDLLQMMIQSARQR